MAAGCNQPCTSATKRTFHADGNDEVERSMHTLARWTCDAGGNLDVSIPPVSKRLHVEGSDYLNVLLNLRT